MSATTATDLMSFKVVGSSKPESVGENQNRGACYDCGIRWSSTALAHCKALGCHQTFSSDSAYTLHRKKGTCVAPQALVRLESKVPYLEWDTEKSWWRFPGDKPEFT